MIKFITNGSLIDIKQGTDNEGYNVVASLNSNSKNITWGYGSDTSRINFTIDDKTFDSIPATDIYFDGVALSDSTGFKAAIEGMFPNLAGGGGSSYLVYTALLTQTGTNNPPATELQNDFGITSWVRGGIGYYEATSTIPSTYTIYIGERFVDPDSANTSYKIHYGSSALNFMYSNLVWYDNGGFWVFGIQILDSSYAFIELSDVLSGIGMANGFFALPKIEAYAP